MPDLYNEIHPYLYFEKKHLYIKHKIKFQEIKIKCLEEDTTQAEIAEKAGTTGSYVSRLINKNDGIINKTFVRLLEELGYDVELTYVKKEA